MFLFTQLGPRSQLPTWDHGPSRISAINQFKITYIWRMTFVIWSAVDHRSWGKGTLFRKEDHDKKAASLA